jgi:hypothetical protein
MSSFGASGVAAVAFAICASTHVWAGECGFRPAFDRPDEGGSSTVKVFRGDAVPALGNIQPLLFVTSLKVNTDGTKVSYHQDDPTGRRCERDPAAAPCALNNIRNAYRDPRRPESEFTALRDAGYPNPQTWQLLSSDIIEKSASTGKPCTTSDGYLVSMTADVAVSGGFSRVGDCDVGKWIDALTVPAIVIPNKAPGLPSQFLDLGVGKRSLVVAVSRSATKRVVPGVVGDFGPPRELGEATVAMNRGLNGLPETDQPRHRRDAIARFQADRTAVLLFPGSEFVLARPITGARVAQAGTEALTRFGGIDKLYGCIRDEIEPSF